MKLSLVSELRGKHVSRQIIVIGCCDLPYSVNLCPLIIMPSLFAGMGNTNCRSLQSQTTLFAKLCCQRTLVSLELR